MTGLPPSQPFHDYGPSPSATYGPAQKHSGLGIASFVLGIVCGLSMFALFGVAGYMETTTPGGVDEQSAEAIALGLGIMALMAGHAVGLTLGIVGLCLPDRQKLFAILGTVLNGLVVLGAGGLIALGIIMEGV